MNELNVSIVSASALEYFNGDGGTKSAFVSNYPFAIYSLLIVQLFGALLNIYLVRIIIIRANTNYQKINPEFFVHEMLMF